METILRKNKLLLICILLSIHSAFSFAQKENNDFILSTSAHIGTALVASRVQPAIKGDPTGIELNFIIPTHGARRWQRNYHYPEMGLSFFAMDFGNPPVLGQGYSLHPFINFNLSHGKKFTLKFKITNSLGYVTKYYDPVSNPLNLAIGSHFNGFVNLRLNAQIRLSENLRIETGIGLTHFSNGAMDLPNAGMNVASFDLGFGYHFNSKNVKLLPDTFSFSDHGFHFVTYASTGMCSISRTNQSKYVAGIFSVNLERSHGSRTKWNCGLEVVYNSARLRETQNDTSIHNYTQAKNIQAGFKIGYAFVAGRLMLPIEMGIFLYSNPLDGYFFHRVGVRYQISDHFIVGVTLKTQFARADFFEWGLGYTFPMKK